MTHLFCPKSGQSPCWNSALSMAPGLRSDYQIRESRSRSPIKVSDLMTKSVASCRSETNLASAGALMREADCGILPVVDERRRVTGVLTDRDVCIALTTKDRRAFAMTVGEVSSPRAFTCGQ